jgi:hypothetical protein
MWFDQHPYISIYLTGCVLAVVLIFFKVILTWIVCWVTKENILNKNVKKIQKPNDRSFLLKAGLFMGGLIFEAALSWVNVIVVTWQIFTIPFRVLRETLTTVPDDIKSLRFPLRNNPYMSREAVWAHLFALTVKAGDDATDETNMRYSLDEVAEYYIYFNRESALKQLGSLNVVGDGVIIEVMNKQDSSDDDFAY